MSFGRKTSTPRHHRAINSGPADDILNDTTVVMPKSGLSIDPTSIFREIVRGTSFENDPAMTEHLNVFADAFHNVARTKQGEQMLNALEGIGMAVKDSNGFVDSITVMFRLAQKIGSDPMVQFGLFVGLIGVVVAVVAHFGPVGLASTGLKKMMRSLYRTLFVTAIAPLVKGTKSAIASFFKDDKSLGNLVKECKEEEKS